MFELNECVIGRRKDFLTHFNHLLMMADNRKHVAHQTTTLPNIFVWCGCSFPLYCVLKLISHLVS